MNASEPQLVREYRSLVIRAIWFILIGWWATGIWLSVAWVLLVLIITIPIGIKMINYVPLVLSLKSPTRSFVDAGVGGTITRVPQRPLVIRAVWFVFIGWWASGILMVIAYLFTISIIGIPIAIWLYGQLPLVVSLYRY